MSFDVIWLDIGVFCLSYVSCGDFWFVLCVFGVFCVFMGCCIGLRKLLLGD